MRKWRARAYLLVLAAAAIAGALVLPWLPEHAARDVLAGGLFVGGLAMLVTALSGLHNGDGDGHAG